MKKKERWAALAKAHKQAAITAMEPDEMRYVAGLFVMHTACIFLLYPLICFILCLLVNNTVFCERPSQAVYPDDLAYMLWILVPGYLMWNWLVVAVWADVLAVVLGKEKEKGDGDVYSLLQRQIAFCIQPALMLLFWGGAWIYRVVVISVEGGMIRAVESVMHRSQGDKLPGGGVKADKKW